MPQSCEGVEDHQPASARVLVEREPAGGQSLALVADLDPQPG
jgi:hypothetical protein